jgi:hypothetical protein
MRRALFTVGIASSVLFAAACGGGGNGSGPPPTLPPPTLAPMTLQVVAAESADGKTISIFKLPITSASKAMAAIVDSGASSMAFDASGRLFVANGGIQVFTQPITSGTEPAFIIPPPSASQVSWGALAFDQAGNLFAVGGTPGSGFSFGHTVISMIPAPITSSSTVNFSFGSLILVSRGTSFDPNGDIWLARPPGLVEFSPPFSGGNVKYTSYNIPNEEVNTNSVAFDSADNMYVFETKTTPPREGSVAVYKPPFTSPLTPAFVIGTALPSAGARNALAFDTTGKMYVATSSGLKVFSPPFGSASAPIVSLPGAFSAVGVLGP